MRMLLALPIVLPLLGGGAVHPRRPLARGAAGDRPRRRCRRSCAIAIAILVRVDDDGIVVVQAGDWPAPLGITLVADRLSAIMLVTASVVLLAVLVYAIGQPGAERNHVGFQSVYMILAAGVSACVPHRRPVQPVRRHRDDAHRELRADDARRSPRAGPLRHDLRRHQPRRLGAVPRRPRPRLRLDRHGQHGRPRRRGSPSCRAACAAALAGLLLVVFGIKAALVPAVLLAAGQLPDGAVGRDRHLRRAAHEGRRVRHHPHADAAVPARTADRRR